MLARAVIALLLPAAVPAGAPFTVEVLAEGLESPDGLAVSPDGDLYVAEEGSGRVSRISADGTAFEVMSGLRSPEGVCFDPDGNLYVTEDVPGGRVLRRDPSGLVTEIASADCPEDVAIMPDGSVAFTWSTAQTASTPLGIRTGISRAAAGSDPETLLGLDFLFSFSGLACGPDGLLYVANELSSGEGSWSVLVLDPSSGEAIPFCLGLSGCEGLCFSGGGRFPLLVVEESVQGSGGRLIAVDREGAASVLAAFPGDLEDACPAPGGGFYVSSDGDGKVLYLRPEGVREP